MITFFRNIRKSLLGAGQARRYLLYAIGENALVVVVIGCSIALQSVCRSMTGWISNLNEAWKTQSQINDYLDNLVSDLNENIAKYIDKYRNQHMRFHSFIYVLDLA